jgi:hypothetical protein
MGTRGKVVLIEWIVKQLPRGSGRSLAAPESFKPQPWAFRPFGPSALRSLSDY